MTKIEPLKEVTLTKERLHWGIFIPALLTLIFLPLPLVPVLFLWRAFSPILNQFNSQATNPFSGFIWVMLILELLMGVPSLIVTWFAYKKSELTLTNRRLLFRTGVLSRFSGELPLENIESIFIFEPLFGRLFGYGTVSVTSIGGKTFPLRFIGSPNIFLAKLQKAVSDAKSPIKAVSKPPSPDNDSRYMPAR